MHSGIAMMCTLIFREGYNIYNAAACVAAAEIVGIDEDTAVDALSRFECGFGRAEQFELGKSKARMMLVKNPAGVQSGHQPDL
ncbi:MAG: hypothetical protein ACLR2O_07115 [Coprococcus sp.]